MWLHSIYLFTSIVGSRELGAEINSLLLIFDDVHILL